VKWGTTSIGTFVISCDSDLPEGVTRAGRDYAVVLHERGGGVRVIAERASTLPPSSAAQRSSGCTPIDSSSSATGVTRPVRVEAMNQKVLQRFGAIRF
jgi:hypothetical protein